MFEKGYHLPLILLSIFICDAVGAKSKYVTLNLDAKWGDTPSMLEASEYLAEESNEKFWAFVNKIGDLNPESYINDDEETHYNRIVKLAMELLSPLQLDLFKFALSMRAHSPRVEMFNQVGWDKISPKSCEAFVDVNNLLTCDKNAIGTFIADAQGKPKPLTIKSDHHYPGTEFVNTTVILYVEIGTQLFHTWHSILKELAERREINYIIRHYIATPSDRKVRLSGYGIELAIKSQEYKAKDDTKVEDDGSAEQEDEEEEGNIQGFDFSKLKTVYPNLNEDLEKFKQHLLSANNELPELKVWQLQDLSYQAGQVVVSAPEGEQLTVLRDISQNFPSMTRLLTKTTVTDSLKKEIKKNQNVWGNKLGVSPGESAMFINGMQADLDTYDVFTLLDTMKSEATVMEGLHSLGLQGEELSNMMKLELGSDSDTSYAVDYRDPAIVYLNNLEKDRRYQGWPSSVTEMLRPSFPGMLRHIRKNLFTALFIVDPANLNQRELLKMAEGFYVHSAPIRMGLLFIVNQDPEVDGMEDAGVALYRAFSYLSKEERPIKALEFITDLYARLEKYPDEELTGELVIEEFRGSYSYFSNTENIFGIKSSYDDNRLVYSKAENSEVTSDLVYEALHQLRPMINREEIFGKQGTQYDKNRKESAEAFVRMGLGELPQVLINGVPMKPDELQADAFEEAIVSNIMTLTPELQKAVYNGNLYDGKDVPDYIMTRSHVMPRLNARVLSTDARYLDLTKTASADIIQEPEKFISASIADKTGAIVETLKYVTKKEESSIRSLTSWIVGDLDQPAGRSLVYDALKQLKSCASCRVGLVNNPTAEISSSTDNKTTENLISKAVHVALQTQPNIIAKSFITKLMKEENVEALSKGEKTFEDLSVNGLGSNGNEDMNMDMPLFITEFEKTDIRPVLQSHQIFSQFVLGFQKGERGVVSNGKILGPLRPEESFTQEDFSLLEKYSSKSSANKIEKNVKKLNWDNDKSSDLIMKVASLLLSAPESEESRKDTPYSSNKHSAINISPRDPDSPAYDVVAILDPSTRAAQKYTPLIMVLNQVTNANIKVFLNCKEKLSEMPLKSYYRYVLEPEVRFHADSKLSIGPSVAFRDLPSKPILTLVVDTPDSWLVESVRSVYDLDNIHLEDIDSAGVHADFELEYLLLEGHCFDAQSGQPPRGLQFVLGTHNEPAMVDTIVMANLGYFQLKAAPGLWNLQLRAGKSREIYDITSHEHTDSPPDSNDVIAVMDSLKSKIIKVRVAKQAGQEQENLLTDKEEPSGGFWDSLSSTFVPGSGSGGTEEGDDVINIFSLASGHLYERFMRIMITSVIKTTQSKVKFWFLKNYLSPSFKDFIPHLAKEYGFDYEFVQYKWPRWLHQQTEKQRVMWGYKILFLDVLFPLNINKIIFVDADQIVRTDLKELVDLDLEGAPYGYTPFCDSRTEMDGFRFWKSGYWNSHLSGRKYHISALYVVDLKQFRKIAAGDRLRGQYQGLSQDPNSLSNLDQDLPNNMIHQVPIKSLPQEWLWCETWCSDSEKASAKTIDLCNNPKTKEPKLTAAQRIVPEWTEYDNQVKALWDKVYKTSHSSSKDQTSKTNTEKHTEL